MPLPWGHTAIGLATHNLLGEDRSSLTLWKAITSVAILVNLPDIDIIIGLILEGNGYAFHRGPTHSLVFALAAGLIASNIGRCWPQIPRLSFTASVLLVLSHILSDALFTGSPVSFLWPLKVNRSMGYIGWVGVLDSIFFEAFQDIGIIITCGGVILLNRLLKYKIIPPIASRLKH
jgi:membrane-bound metal-dependent hydrolase YbcI (DUF457 family)